jgi:hypothetical protein
VLATVLDTPKKRIILGAVLAVLVLGGVALAVVAGGDDEEAAPTTTTTSTTVPETTTTAAPAPVAPLTGMGGDHLQRLERPALVVKIDNVEPKARPQAGINEADVVYEERVEGSVTRLLAIFHSTDAAPVGPVRSGRTSDIPIFSTLHRPYFAWSGANNTFAQRLRAAAMVDVGYDAASDQYYRDGGRPGTSNLMLRSTDHIMRLPAEGSTPPPPIFTFRTPDNPQPAHWQPSAGVHISYGGSAGSAPVEYRWNGSGWARFQKGTPHVDANGVQVAPANVIVHFAGYVPTDVGDQFGVPIPEAQLVGDGPAWVFTAGGVVEGKWSKPALDVVTSYTDVDGNPIGLSPGRTWIALAPPGGTNLL